ncbi:MAG: hypothetical protein JNJ65_08275 [Cyclobacteriaceae bacterium]|nr:hypothetical protein [Cyclobacteriaceae bacterium]
MIRYLSSMLALFVAVATFVFLGSRQAWWPLPAFWMEILLFILFITLVIGYNLLRLRKKQPDVFVQFYLLSIALKMGAGLAFIFFLVIDSPNEAFGSAALFIISYILFTVLEVLFLVRRDG